MRNLHFTRRQSLGLMAAGATALIAPASLAKSTPGASITTLQKGSADFDRVRATMTWNARIAGARTPEAIVEATSTADVVAAVKYARAHNLKVAIRGGGHNYHGAVLRDGSLLLDLSRLKLIKIDAAGRRASVGPGIKGGELIAALAPHNLAFPVGHCSDVNLSGFLLNGGYGWNLGEWARPA